MREKFSLPEHYYKDQHQQEADDALSELGRNPELQHIESSLAEKTP